jgi:hypothetical protein
MRMLHLLSSPEVRTISGINQIPGQPNKYKTDSLGNKLSIFNLKDGLVKLNVTCIAHVY